jgi:glycosyltransferase involved in cell wall biosynthesis
MYARHTIGVIVRTEEPQQNNTLIDTIPEYVDTIYIADAAVRKDFVDPRIVRLGDPVLERDESAWLCTAYKKALEDAIDITVIVMGEDNSLARRIPNLLDPIIWEEADLVRAVPHTPVPNNRAGAPNEQDVFVYRSRIGFSPGDLANANQRMVAVSRKGLELLRRTTIRDRAGRTLAAIPCFNEEARIGSVILSARQYVDEVLVVDDGSTDESARIAEEAGATVITHSKNRGYGGAIRTCFDYARERFVDVMVVLDGDGQHAATEIPEFLQTVSDTDADIVIGSRFLEETITMPLYRRVGAKVLDIATLASGKVRTTDSQSGYRAYDRRAIEQIAITDDAMGAGSEILAQGVEHGLTIAEVPIRVRYDLDDTSSQHPVTHGIDVLSSLVWRIAEKRPFSYLGLPGAAFILVALGAGVQSTGDYLRTGHFVALPYALVISILMIVGITGLFTGLTLNIINRASRS